MIETTNTTTNNSVNKSNKSATLTSVTLTEFLDRQKKDPALQKIIITIAEACKKIRAQITLKSAASTQQTNPSGEQQLGLDDTADQILTASLKETGLVRHCASEEQKELMLFSPTAPYSVVFDPLDGSSLIDVNLSIGTIVGIHKGDLVMHGERSLIAALYVVYGPLTTLVFSVGNGVHQFCLEGEDFVLEKENIKLKQKGSLYAIGGLRKDWLPEHGQFIESLEGEGYKLRYSGGLVPDVHQVLLKGGGLFTYPRLHGAQDGKLRLLFEVEPFSFILQQAGGRGSTGEIPVLDVVAKDLHQRVPAYLGSVYEVEKAETMVKQGRVVEQGTMKEMPVNKQVNEVHIPADVPPQLHQEYLKNYLTMTHNTGRLMLFAGDQKIEHLNDDFYGKIKVGDTEVPIPLDDADPEHLFKVASSARIGVFAAQLGLIAKYGPDYKNVPYLVKLNSKSHLVKTTQKDPQSQAMTTVEHIVKFKKDSGLNIVAVGYTVYTGSEFESEMIKEAAQASFEAHQNGLLAVFWMYPRGKAVLDEKDPHLIAGAAGMGACLGADFVKVNYPKPKEGKSAEAFKEAILAAGKRTGVITAGGGSKGVRDFLQETWDQINISGCRGNATGRNIHQKPLAEAIRLANAISAITLDLKSVDEAMKMYTG